MDEDLTTMENLDEQNELKFPGEDLISNISRPKKLGFKRIDEKLIVLKSTGSLLQIVQLKRADQPYSSKDVSVGKDGNPFYDIVLTDGFFKYQAVYLGSKNVFAKANKSGVVYPGEKVKLIGDVQVWQGVLHLNENNLQYLGGRVEALVEKYEEQQAKKASKAILQ